MTSQPPKVQIAQGYEFVPLAPQVHRRHRPEVRLDRRIEGTLSGRIRLRMMTEQPIHVGSGGKVLEKGEVVRTCVHIEGRPGIPGSTLKGLLRARYEAITKSCAGVTKLRPGWEEGIRSSTGIKKAHLAPEATKVQPALVHCHTNKGSAELCPACALFGCSGQESQRGRLSCSDLVQEHTAGASIGDMDLQVLPAQFGPNLHHLGPVRRVTAQGVESFEVFRLEGRKFALSNSTSRVSAPAPSPGAGKAGGFKVEVIPKHRQLTGMLMFQNLLPEELGGLLTALGQEPCSFLKLGAARAHGLGRVRVTVESLELWDAGRKPVSQALQVLRDAFLSWQDRWPTGEERLIALHQGDC